MDHRTNIVINRMKNVLVATLQVTLTEDVLKQFKHQLLEMLEKQHVPYVIFDYSGMDIIDPSEFEATISISKMIKIMGAYTYFVGLQPSVVSSLIRFDVNIQGIRTALNIDEALLEIQP